MDTIEQELFSASRRLLLSERKKKPQKLIFPVIMFLLFIASLFSLLPLFDLGCIIGALLIHEAGHYLGMLFLGYTDLRIFFIPFFGGAVSGRCRTGENSWREAVVLLAGPLPGLVAGITWFALAPTHAQGDIAAWWLIVLNGFNLLPLMPLDGGRILNLILFSRHYLLEMSFLTLTSIGLFLLGWWLHNYLLGAVGIISLCTVPLRFRLTQAASQLRPDWAGCTPDVRELSRDEHERLFMTVRSCFPSGGGVQIQVLADRMESVHRLAHVSPLSVSLSIVLILVYTGLLILGLISLGIISGTQLFALGSG